MDGPIPRYALLDVWVALGGEGARFEKWADSRSIADGWAQLMAAAAGRWPDLFEDTNPSAGELLDLHLLEQGE